MLVVPNIASADENFVMLVRSLTPAYDAPSRRRDAAAADLTPPLLP